MRKTAAAAILCVCHTLPICWVSPAKVSRAALPPALDVQVRTGRAIHKFDFDERASGNLEDVPRYWEPLRMPGFPRFAKGGFDMAVGHYAPPSLHLSSEGRNIVYSYAGPETAVRPSSDYRIEAFVRTSGLEHARACLSACFLDESREPIFGSMVRSAWLGEAAARVWKREELFLLSAPPEAATISIQMWILQDSLLDTESGSKRIHHADLKAEAWLDDVSVSSVPRVQLTTGVPGNVIGPGDPEKLRIMLGDVGDLGAQAELSVTDADGKVVLRRHVDDRAGDDSEVIVPLTDLQPGLYYARLEEIAAGGDKISRTLTFARLGNPIDREEVRSHSLGIVLDSEDAAPTEAAVHLLQRQGVRAVKLPIWYDPEVSGAAGAARAGRLPQELARHGYALTAMLCGSASVGGASEHSCGKNLLQTVRDDTVGWREMLSRFAADNAGTFRLWQLGSDESEMTLAGEAFFSACDSLRKSLTEFIPTPQLGAAVASDVESADTAPPIAQPTVRAEAGASPESIKAVLNQQHTLGFERVAAYVAPLPAPEFQRVPRLSEWALRILTALGSGADGVFVPQTWRRRVTPEDSVIEPTEEFVILHTIAEVFADAQPGPNFVLPDGAHFMVFNSGEGCVLTLWNPTAPDEGRETHVQLGRASRAIDLWGRSETLSRDEKGQHVLRLSPTPVFVDGVDRFLIDLMSAASIQPDRISVTGGVVRQSLEFDYKGSRSISGHLIIQGPQSLTISPRQFDIRLTPGRKESFPFEVLYDQYEPAGRKQLVLQIDLDQDSRHLEVPLTSELGVPGLEVSGLAFVRDNVLFLRHFLRNGTDAEVNFRGMASAPGRERQSKPFLHIRPGETQIMEYRFSEGAALVGRTVRLGLREMNDGPRMHSLDLVVP